MFRFTTKPLRKYRVMLQKPEFIWPTYTIRQATGVGDFAYEAAGAGAIFTANPFERRFRDLHAIAQQLQGRKSHYETVGRFLLGLESTTPFL